MSKTRSGKNTAGLDCSTTRTDTFGRGEKPLVPGAILEIKPGDFFKPTMQRIEMKTSELAEVVRWSSVNIPCSHRTTLGYALIDEDSCAL